jgi:hypothetical protein
MLRVEISPPVVDGRKGYDIMPRILIVVAILFAI